MYSEWYEPPQYSEYHQHPQAQQDFEYQLPQALQSYEYYQPQCAQQNFEGYPPQQYQEDFNEYPSQQYEEDFEWYPPPHAQQDLEGYLPPNAQQDFEWYQHPPPPPPATQQPDVTALLQQILQEQNAMRADINIRIDASRKDLNNKLEQLNFRLQQVESQQASSSSVKTTCQLPSKALQNSVSNIPVTEDNDVQVGGDDYIIKDDIEISNTTPLPQLEVTQDITSSSKKSAPPSDMSKSSTSPPLKASDYHMQALMNEEIIDGESLQYLFACEETENPPPEKSCNLPSLDLEQEPFEDVNGAMEIVDELVVVNEETDHLSGMMIEDLEQINNSILEEPLILSLIAPLDMLSVEFNIKPMKDYFHLEENLARVFTPCYADMINYLVVEKMLKFFDQYLEKQFFGDVNYNFCDEPTLYKRGSDDSSGRHLHTETESYKRLLNSQKPIWRPNVHDEESKSCSPKVKMKPTLNGLSNWFLQMRLCVKKRMIPYGINRMLSCTWLLNLRGLHHLSLLHPSD